ncbi:MAG: ATP-binding cassette domain-containing protein, partial [Candidatus Eremiobacteraeota bacterium]|nr:ATP-binding cassette domain-containing protein [Candidatus Eremiobacteraeota bacterium]
MLTVENLSHTYLAGNPLAARSLVDVSLTIEAGELVCLSGPTGSGKSTLLAHLNGLIPAQQGSIRVDGTLLDTPARRRQARQKVALAFQFPEHQLFEKTVRDELLYGPRQFRLDHHDQRLHKALAMVGLSDNLLERNPGALSGGEMRKVALASLLTLDPSVLILDEPTAGLDPPSRSQLLANLKTWNQQGLTILVVSHSLDEICALEARLVLLENGRKTFDGPVAEHLETLPPEELPPIPRFGLEARQHGIAWSPLPLTVDQA